MSGTLTYEKTIEKELFSVEEIAAAIERLAREIARDYAGKPLLVLGVLKGALYVTVDLVRALSRLPDGPSRIELDFIVVSSYGNSTRSSGEVRLLKDTGEKIAGRNVLVIEDIIDNGLTLQYLRSLLSGREPASLRSCVLFDKPYNRRVEVPVDYVGLVAPEVFVVGYGLDYQENYRNLPYLAQLQSWVFSE
ncbi:MAG TPA: hypoxanthine phosphoribosyltransferase [Candidatus Rubrimentiphilum sp.]|nr:hypoxanthine phosphoribosyltransferase [Candidatus Rubrimentiphilum sp.]